jgi:hypothetical protein
MITDININDQILIRYFALSNTGEKNGGKTTANQLAMDLKKPYDSVTTEVSYNSFSEFSTAVKLF